MSCVLSGVPSISNSYNIEFSTASLKATAKGHVVAHREIVNSTFELCEEHASVRCRGGVT